MMDERLIAEVQKHAIIYNRQKSNLINGDKCITKEIAWQDIARNIQADGNYNTFYCLFRAHCNRIALCRT